MQEIYYHVFRIENHSYLIGATAKGLVFVGSEDSDNSEIKKFYPEVSLIDDESVVEPYQYQLKQYLQGKRTKFDLPIDITGTDFQRSVWRQLQRIPYGQTSNYSKIAKLINRPKAVRAVGTAIGKNPILMIIPCHRVLTKDGNLGGYRGGLTMKRSLLELEKKKS